MSKEYATLKNLVRAIRNLESKPPRSPIKGRNHSRHETSFGPLLFEILKDFGPDDYLKNHVVRIFARRSKKAKYNPMQFGFDQDYISAELNELVLANNEKMKKLMTLFNHHKEFENSLS